MLAVVLYTLALATYDAARLRWSRETKVPEAEWSLMTQVAPFNSLMCACLSSVAKTGEFLRVSDY